MLNLFKGGTGSLLLFYLALITWLPQGEASISFHQMLLPQWTAKSQVQDNVPSELGLKPHMWNPNNLFLFQMQCLGNLVTTTESHLDFYQFWWESAPWLNYSFSLDTELVFCVFGLDTNIFKADRILHNIFFSVYLSFALGSK